MFATQMELHLKVTFFLVCGDPTRQLCVALCWWLCHQVLTTEYDPKPWIQRWVPLTLFQQRALTLLSIYHWGTGGLFWIIVFLASPYRPVYQGRPYQSSSQHRSREATAEALQASFMDATWPVLGGAVPGTPYRMEATGKTQDMLDGLDFPNGLGTLRDHTERAMAKEA